MINPSIITFIRRKYETMAIQNTTSYTMNKKIVGQIARTLLLW